MTLVKSLLACQVLVSGRRFRSVLLYPQLLYACHLSTAANLVGHIHYDKKKTKMVTRLVPEEAGLPVSYAARLKNGHENVCEQTVGEE